MTFDSKSPNNNRPPSQANHQHLPSSSSSLIQRDRFELLSAYMDGEVTAAERKQVEEWLAKDPTVQRLHARLLKLRQGLQTMPVPASKRSVEQTVDQVLSRVERQPKLSLVWGGAAIAALFIGALVNVLPMGRESAPQMATGSGETRTAQTNPTAEPLLVALDKPLVAIPKAPVAIPETSVMDSGNLNGSE